MAGSIVRILPYGCSVSRIGGNFSFLFDTFILLFITFGVVRSLSSQVGLPWFIPPRGILLCVGPHPKFISGSSLRGVVTRAVFSSNCYGFLGALAFGTRQVAPRRLTSYFWGNLRSAPPPHRRWQTRSRLLLPDQAGHDCNLNFKLRSRPPAWI